MKTYKISIPYWSVYVGYVDAENEEEARKKFDDIPTEDLNEEYMGLLDAYEETIEEIEE